VISADENRGEQEKILAEEIVPPRHDVALASHMHQTSKQETMSEICTHCNSKTLLSVLGIEIMARKGSSECLHAAQCATPRFGLRRNATAV
jgi:hypothetical protein